MGVNTRFTAVLIQEEDGLNLGLGLILLEMIAKTEEILSIGKRRTKRCRGVWTKMGPKNIICPPQSVFFPLIKISYSESVT